MYVLRQYCAMVKRHVFSDCGNASLNHLDCVNASPLRYYGSIALW